MPPSKICLLAVFMFVLQLRDSFQSDTESFKIYEGNNEFALDLFKAIAKVKPNKNVFLSPLSVSSALAMASLGSRGQTLQELLRVLHVRDNDERLLYESLRDLAGNLAGGSADYDLKIANKIFVDQSVRIMSSYSSRSFSYFSSSPQRVAFRRNIEGARQKINAWTAEQTSGKITNLADSLDEETKLVLVNAVYFRGRWRTPFDREATGEAEFQVGESEYVEVDVMSTPTMHVNETNVDRPPCKIFELPYSDDGLSAFLILPKRYEDLSDVEAGLSADLLRSLRFERSTKAILVPKFSLQSKNDLVVSLKRLGLRDLFRADRADLRKMTSSTSLFVSSVMHDAFIEVNEEGSEAAATTRIVTLARSRRTIEVDRPFLFYIQDKRSGSILFIGKVVDPRKRE